VTASTLLWVGSDSTSFVLPTHPEVFFVRPLPFVLYFSLFRSCSRSLPAEHALLPRLRSLDGPASRLMLSLLEGTARQHAKAFQAAVYAPLFCSSSLGRMREGS
jgi:hypothetical protein